MSNTEVEHYDSHFLGEDFSSKNIGAESFIACELKKCKFDNATLSDTIFHDCKFSGCSFNLTKLRGVQLQNVDFEGCKFVGITFDCDTINSFLMKFSFADSKLLSCTFANLELPSIKFSQSNIHETTFNNCALVGADFSSCNFERNLFDKCNLANANFQDSVGFNIDPRVNYLKGAKFSYSGALDLLAPFEIQIN